MDLVYAENLLIRIQAKCEREHWYGPDMRDPDWFDKYDRNGRIPDCFPEPKKKLWHPERVGFASSPLTEEQLVLVETRLNHALPPFFRMVYTRLADGGFGPEYGLESALTFVPDMPPGYTPIELTDCARDPVMTQNTQRVWWHVPLQQWPPLMMQLVDCGCCAYVYLDICTEMIYEGATFGPEGRFLLSVLAPSLEDFLERWTRDECLSRAW